jgi:superfamily II DNA/RNA helicase
MAASENAATLLRRFFLSVLPAERQSAPRGRRRHARPAAPRTVTSAVPHATSFAAAGVPAPLVAALAAAGITTPFPIQAATLPDALAGRDILGRGQTGSGKTLGFCIPLAAGLIDGYTSACRPRGLVLVPTRELASQVHAVLAPLAASVGLSVAAIYGGVPQKPQVASLRNRADIVVACPGRLADLIEQGHCHLGDVEISVLDEADHMADLGFLPVVRRLLDMTPPGGQRMLFSATLDAARRLARQLTAGGIPAAELHGDLAQGARERNLASFAAGTVRVIVATDIAARGIHVDGIDLVVHADPPAEHKAYLHRSGRTARAGATGTVITLQDQAQAADVRSLMRKAGVVPLAAAVTPSSPLLRSIAGEPAAPVTLPVTASPAAIVAIPAAGRGAAAMSAGFRGRRRR